MLTKTCLMKVKPFILGIVLVQRFKTFTSMATYSYVHFKISHTFIQLAMPKSKIPANQGKSQTKSQTK
jgi:hypothetical protein